MNPTARLSGHGQLPSAQELRTPFSNTPIGTRFEDHQLFVMTLGFAATGGVVDGDTLARRMHGRWYQPVSALARQVAAREVVSFVWRSSRMMPLFQFDLATLTVHAHVTRVIAELKDVFDDWDLALWFAQPNALLDHHAPVNLIERDAMAVYEAARTDRFIARG